MQAGIEHQQRIAHAVDDRFGEVARDLPEGLEPIILRCLEKLPERRYPNMKELLRDLANLQERELEAAGGPAGEPK